MPRIVRNQLSAPRVRHAGPGRFVDGNGLMLYVKRSGARSWVQRLTIHGERVDLGLGSADPGSAEHVSLAQARRIALDNRRVARAGGDPRRVRVPSFDRAQQATYAESLPRWSESGRLAQKWRQTMRDYVLPKIGPVPVDAVAARHVKRALAPIAAAGHVDTMSRVGDRISQTLEWARIEGYYTAPNPVKAVVGSLRTGRVEPRHMRAARYDEVAVVLARADAQTRTPPATRLALRLLVLTAARTREVRLMEWADVDTGAAVWTRPGGKMKAGKAHRVPLSRQALEVLERARLLGAGRGLVFPATRAGGMLSDNAMRRLVSRLGVDATPHGFRSSFKDWARNHDVDETLSEFALAHVEGSATVRAYARDDLLDRRRPVMQAWADYLDGGA